MDDFKKYIISGAGGGIGKAITQKLAQQGNICYLLGRDKKSLEQTLKSLPGAGHKVLLADIRNKESLIATATEISGTFIDGLIANAGIGGENYWGQGDRWDDIIATNLTGTYNFVNTFLPQLVNTNNEKHIVIISSVLARLGVSNYAAYCASKAGLLGLMRSWAVQLAPEKILVNAICPGWVDTEMSQQGLQGIADSIGITKDEFYNIAMQSVPLRKMCHPDEIADLVEYLVRQRSITGQIIDINGGSVMSS